MSRASPERSAKLHRTKTKPVPQLIRRARKLPQLPPAFRFEQIELRASVAKAAEAHAEQPNLALAVPVLPEESKKNRKDVRIQAHRFAERLRTRVRIESRVTNRQDRKSTRLNSSHLVISYAVFCLKKKT